MQLLRFLSPNTGRDTLCSLDKSFGCFVREVEVVIEEVTTRAFLTSVFLAVEADVEVEEGGGRAAVCSEGGGRDVEAVVVFKGSLDGALLRCVGSCFPVDPPPFCDAFCFTTFSSSI